MATAPKKAAPAKGADTKTAPKAVAKTQTTAVAVPEDMPEFMRGSTGRGNEHVSVSDVVIPRVELIQALSPCLKRNDPAYMEGSEPGMFFNSVSRELYGERVTVVPVLYRKQYLVWKDRKQGGGFGGAYDTPQDAALRIKEEPQDEQRHWEAIETGQQLVLVLKGDGTTEEAVVSMARTKLKISKQWNSMIRLAGGDRFARTYDLVGVEDSSDKGDFHNIQVVSGKWVSKEIYNKAEELYLSVESGARKMTVDTSDGDEASDTNRESGEY